MQVYGGPFPFSVLSIRPTLSFSRRKHCPNARHQEEYRSRSSVMIGPHNDPCRSVLRFLHLTTKCFAKAIPDQATIIKMGLNQSLVNLDSCIFVVIYGLIRFKAPIAEAIFFEILSICFVQVEWLSIYTPRDLTERPYLSHIH